MIRLLALLWLLATPALAEIAIQPVTTPGGLTAWLVEDHSIPFTALEIRFRGGTSLDPQGKRGATTLMTGLIEEGAGPYDSRGFAEAQEALATGFGFSARADALSVSARMLTENRDQAVDLLRTALVDPRFDEDSIARVKAQVFSIIRSEATDPDSIAADTFRHLAYPDHPYGTDDNGTLDSVGALTRQDLLDIKAATMARDRVVIGAVGDITPEDLGKLIDRLLGDLPATGAPMPGTARYALKPGLTVVPFDTPQSVAIFGHEGIALDDPDYLTAMILDQAIGGGGFSSRLMDEVREKRGLTYGIGTSLMTLDHGNLYLGQVASANDRMAETVEVIRAEWARAAEGLTETELEDAKTYLTGAYALRFDGNATIANIIVGMQMSGLPIDYAATRNDKVDAVTMEDIRRVAKRLYRPQDLAFVIVGQPTGLATSN